MGTEFLIYLYVLRAASGLDASRPVFRRNAHVPVSAYGLLIDTKRSRLRNPLVMCYHSAHPSIWASHTSGASGQTVVHSTVPSRPSYIGWNNVPKITATVDVHPQ